jgi:hypothetical protein
MYSLSELLQDKAVITVKYYLQLWTSDFSPLVQIVKSFLVVIIPEDSSQSSQELRTGLHQGTTQVELTSFYWRFD